MQAVPPMDADGAASPVTPGLVSTPFATALCSVLDAYPPLLEHVAPYIRKGGKPVFTLFVGGQWRSLALSELVPVVHGSTLFARCANPAVTWPSLLEKAFARLYGSYSALSTVTLADALAMCTSGITQHVSLLDVQPGDPRKTFFDSIRRVIKRGGVGVASIAAPSPTVTGCSTDKGLAIGHGYIITATHIIFGLPMLRLYNPW